MPESSRISRPELRALLNRLLRSSSDLDAFALDYFHDTARNFTPGMDRTQRVNFLFERHEIDEILAALEKQYPDAITPVAPPPQANPQPSVGRPEPAGARPPERPAVPPLVVCLYADSAKYDQNTYLELRKVLAPKLRAGALTLWSQADVLAGDQLELVRSRKLAEAAVVVLLVSSDFLADPELDEIVKRLLVRRAAGSCVVVPLLIRASAWQSSQFGFMRPLPRDGTPISSYKDRDSAWLEVVNELTYTLSQLPPRS